MIGKTIERTETHVLRLSKNPLLTMKAHVLRLSKNPLLTMKAQSD